MEETSIVNRVTTSGIVTLDLTDYYIFGDRVVYDLKENLFKGIILKEKDFREFLKNHDWSQYSGKHVAVTCSEDAIIPSWAYMLLATKLQPFCTTLIFGDLMDLESALFQQALNKIDFKLYKDAKVVIKGCGDKVVPQSAFLELTKLLLPYVASIMYGEPCSTVPVYKRSK